MQCVTTNSIDGKVVLAYRGLVAGEVVFGANFVRELGAAFTDALGGRSSAYEKEFEGARRTALDIIVKKAEALRADAIVGLRFEYQVLGEKNGMMMVAAYGTAVQLAKSDDEKRKDEVRASEEQAQFIVMIGSAERGPFSLEQIRELKAASRIDDSTLVRIEGSEEQRPLADILRKNG